MNEQATEPAEPSAPAGKPKPTVRTRGLAGRLVLVFVVLAVGTVGVLFLTRATTPKPGLSASDIPALQVSPAPVQPGSAIPVSLTAADPVTAPNTTTTGQPSSLTDWATRVAAATGIPEPAVWAYGNAELAMRSLEPGCQLSWATLAGIGRVESDHGQFGGAHLLPNGEESKPVIGIPLDGSDGTRAIPDSSDGSLTGDSAYAHAVGPMQFVPGTWQAYAMDAMGTGHPDPENINDATLTAGHYLCVGGRNMGTPDGWWAGILSYNDSVDYAQKVFGMADTYARQADRALTSGH